VKRLALVCFLLSAACAAFGQAAWKQYWQVFEAPRAASIIQPHKLVPAGDGGAYLISDDAIAKYAPDGSVQWSTPFFDGFTYYSGQTDSASLVETSTGIYVAGAIDTESHGSGNYEEALIKFDLSGNFVFCKTYGLFYPSIDLFHPEEIFALADSAGDLILNYQSNILKCDANGNLLWQAPGINGMTSIDELDHAGNLLNIWNLRGGRVTKFSPNGLTQWSVSGTEYSDFQPWQCCMVIGPDNSIYAVTDNGMEKISPSGAIVWSNTQFPSSIALNTDGTLWASGSSAIVRFSAATGASIDAISTNGGALYPDGAGNVYFIYYHSINPPLWNVRVEKYNSAFTKVLTYDLSTILGPGTWGTSFAGNAIYCQLKTGASTVAAAKVSLDGTLVWSNAAFQNKSTWVSRVVGRTASNGTTFLLGGTTAVADNTAVTAIDKNGRVLFSNFAPLGGGVDVLPESDGGFVAVGGSAIARYTSSGTRSWITNFGGGSPSMDANGNILGSGTAEVGAFKLSPNGVLLWSFPSLYHDDAITKQDSFGNLYDGYQLEDANQQPLNQFGMSKISPSGTLLYSRIFQLPADYTYARVHLGSVDDTGSFYLGGAKFDANGNQLWQGDFGWGKGVYDFVPDGKGNLYGYGLDSTDATGTHLTHFPKILAAKVNAGTGSVEWTKSVALSQSNWPVQALIEPDGAFLVRGYSADADETQWSLHHSCLLEFTPDGALSQTEVTTGPYNTQEDYDFFTHQWFPSGIGADTSGYVYMFGNSLGPDSTSEFKVTKYGPPPPDDATITLTAANPMAAGQTYGVGVVAKNVGSNIWTAASGYKLDCLEPSTWGVTSIPLDGTDSIANLQTKTFTVNVNVPSIAGTYLMQFQMDHNGTKFGLPSNIVSVRVVVQTNFASYVSQSVPSSMVSGQSYFVSVQYTNTGQNTWTPGNGYKLQSMNPTGNTTWGIARLPLTTSSVPPGATGTFSGTVIAPAAAGTFNFEWQPIQDTTGLPFGPLTPNVAVSVTKAADAARYISRTGPLTVGAGSDFWVVNTMLNVGSSLWTTSSGYSMMSVNPNNNNVWTITRLYMPTNAQISAGTQTIFAGLCTAPVIPGTYTMQWQCDRLGVPFGDRSPLLNIVVTQAADVAQFISQTAVPTYIGTGLPFGVTFTMKNVGTATWDSSYSLSPIGSNNFGIASIASSSVAPGANGTLTATFTTPTTPGTYTFQWRMSHNGTKFGQATPLMSVNVSTDSAVYVSRTGALTVNAGADFWVQNTMSNTGATTWSGTTGYTMMTVYPANSDATWTATRAYLPANTSVAPGSSGTFTVLCTAPFTPGTYKMQWQCDKSGVPFGEKSPLLTINVVQGADDSQFVNLNLVPTTIMHSKTFNGILNFKNIGTAAWDSSYSLVPIGSNNFGVSSIPAVATNPGSVDSFTTTFTAPATPGTYTFQWRVAHNGVKFGQASVKLTMTVN